MIVALSALLRSVIYPERSFVIAPSEKKADIIMGYIRSFAVENPLTATQLDLSDLNIKERKLKSLKQEKSKKKLTFKRGGSIETLTLDSRNSKRRMEAAMGFGVGDSGNVFFDESSLVDDVLYATVLRMLSGKNTLLFEIGNPFYRNHFFDTWQGDSHHKIFADYHTAIKEGRFTEDFIEGMRGKPFFDVYYDCKFPDEDEIDPEGYRRLIRTDEITIGTAEPTGTPTLGADIGGGGDFNVYVIRWGNIAKVVGHNRSKDTMTNVNEIIRLMGEYRVNQVNIDDVGVGRGVTDRLREMGHNVSGVSVGGSPRDKDKFRNIKAEISWHAKEWLKTGLLEEYKIGYQSIWEQLRWIKYKTDTTQKVLQIEPKDSLKQKTGKSPDFADAFFLTFYEAPAVGAIRI